MSAMARENAPCDFPYCCLQAVESNTNTRLRQVCGRVVQVMAGNLELTTTTVLCSLHRMKYNAWDVACRGAPAGRMLGGQGSPSHAVYEVHPVRPYT